MLRAGKNGLLTTRAGRIGGAPLDETSASPETEYAGEGGQPSAGIQGFGCLIAGDRRFERIVLASANSDEVFPFAPEALIGQDASVVFEREELHRIRNVLGHVTVGREREGVFAKTIGGRRFQVVVHRAGNWAVAEFFPDAVTAEEAWVVIGKSRGLLSADIAPGRLAGFLDGVVQYVRSVLGFDRVVLLRFAGGGQGEAIAETCHPDMPHLVGQLLDGSEVARMLGEVDPAGAIRAIHDVGATDVAVLGAEGQAAQDFPLAILRGKSEALCRHLASMGVASSLVIPVTIDGVVWGAVMCHHRDPVVPSPTLLNALEWAARLIALRIAHVLDVERSSGIEAGGEAGRPSAVALDRVVRQELGPRDDGAHTLRIGGPKVMVSAEAARVLAKAFSGLVGAISDVRRVVRVARRGQRALVVGQRRFARPVARDGGQ